MISGRCECEGLHTRELGEAIEAIAVGEVKLPADLKYVATQMGLKLPPLPVHGT